MSGDNRKLRSAAVWFYFLLTATMAAGQQLIQNNREQREDGSSNAQEKVENKQPEVWVELHNSSKAPHVNLPPAADDSPRLELYAAWGPWSACRPRSCTQSRSKHCRRGAHCSGVVLKEERPCRRPDSLHGRNCDKKRKRRRKHRHKKRKPPFHVVKAKKQKSVGKIGARSGDSMSQWEPVSEDNELSLKGEFKRAYSKWSPWTICTKSCTTQRYRWCKRAAVCGKDIIRETAFCYQEGSHCHVIHKNMMRKGTDDNNIYSGSSPGYTIAPVPLNPPSLRGECGLSNYTRGGWGRTSNMLRIIGGRPTQHGRWPWQVAVLNRFKEAFCGGTLVAPQWVLTAAHCVRKRMYVRLGEYDLVEREGTEQEMRVEYAVTHPQYDIDTVDNDVALLHLPEAVQADQFRRVACLPRPRQPLPARRLCTIIGWGKRRTTDMFGTDVLQEAQVPIVTNEECRGVYEDYHITGNMFCAGDRRGRTDSCAGDSGGPLLCRDHSGRWTVFGITSFGEGCGKRGKFGIYTRLPNYVRWVHRVMKTYTTV